MRSSRGGWLLAAGTVCILSGVWIGWFGVPRLTEPRLSFQKSQDIKPDDNGLSTLSARYPIQGLTRYHVTQGENISFNLDSVQYLGDGGEPRQAMINLANPDDAQPSRQIKQLRQDSWAEAMQAVRQNTDLNSLFLSWWDNSQRIDLLTGRRTWSRMPVAGAFDGSAEQELWRQAAGPFASDEAPLRLFAKWLAMDADQALAEMKNALPAGVPIYLLVCVDDLARLAEIEKLSGAKLGFEARFFPQASDIHTQINEVKHWVNENGGGGYLLQSLPGQGVRAWLITDGQTEKTLFAKLLPFTSSLASQAENPQAVFQSGWGGYLTVYLWNP